MKRAWSGLLTVALLAALAVSARADVLWSPYGDAFYDKHWEELETVIRDFAANGEKGFITLWDAPGGSGVKAQYENGKKVCVYYTYWDWGLAVTWEETESEGWKETYGWVPMAELSLIYDHISFEEEYGGQIRDYQGEFAGYDGDLSRICFYEYPGAPEVKMEITPQAGWEEDWRNQLAGTAGEASCIHRIFEDEDGRTWGYVDYSYGRLESWFCLEEPGGTAFPVREVPEVVYVPPQKPVMPAAAYAPYVLVGGVVALTAGALFWFYGRKRSGEKE